jgi:hypothetical protein
MNSSGAPFGFGKKWRVSRKLLELAENSGGICGEDVAGKTADSDVRFQKFGVVVCDGIFVRCHDAVISAGERAGPGFVGSESFVVFKDLA